MKTSCRRHHHHHHHHQCEVSIYLDPVDHLKKQQHSETFESSQKSWLVGDIVVYPPISERYPKVERIAPNAVKILNCNAPATVFSQNPDMLKSHLSKDWKVTGPRPCTIKHIIVLQDANCVSTSEIFHWLMRKIRFQGKIERGTDEAYANKVHNRIQEGLKHIRPVINFV